MTMPTQTRESGFKTNADYKITFEPSPRRVRVQFNGETVYDLEVLIYSWHFADSCSRLLQPDNPERSFRTLATSSWRRASRASAASASR
jgi:hypothetical protein